MGSDRDGFDGLTHQNVRKRVTRLGKVRTENDVLHLIPCYNVYENEKRKGSVSLAYPKRKKCKFLGNLHFFCLLLQCNVYCTKACIYCYLKLMQK